MYLNNNLRQFLAFADGEINNFKLYKNKEIEEIKLIKERFDKLSHKLDISHKDLIQRVDLIYSNKFDSFKREMDKVLENINQTKSIIELNGKNSDFSQIEEEIKKNQESTNQVKEDLKKEINDILDNMKKNKEIIDANNIIINKQKEDYNILREQLDQLSADVENLKFIKINTNENNNNNSIKINNNKNQKLEEKKRNSKNNSRLNLKYINNQKISSNSNLIKVNNDNKTTSKKNDIKYLNEDIKYLIPKDKKKNSLFITDNNNNNNKNNNIIKNKDKNNKIKAQTFSRNKKKRKTLVPPNIHINIASLIKDYDNNIDNIDINSDNNYDNNYDNKDNKEKIFKRKINKKLLTYCQKSNFIFERNNLTKNHPINILDLSSSSFSSSSDRDINKQNQKNNIIKKEKITNKYNNQQININVYKNLEINKKINKNVSKLIKLKPIEKPIKLNLKDTYENINVSNNETVNKNLNNININKNITQNKEKTVNFTINAFNKSKVQNKNIPTENNNNEISSGHRNLNLTDKEILKNYFNNNKNENKDINSIKKAIHIKHYKNAFTSPNIIENKKYPINDDINGDLELNNSQKNSNDENNSNNESNNYITSPYITTKNLKSLYRIDTNFYNKKNNDFKNNELNLLSGFLTSIPIKSQTNNEKEEEEKTIINKKIKKMNHKLNKINSNTKIIINRLNLLEVNYKPLNSQINDISMIILLIYEYIKKRNTNNKLNNGLFDTNIRSHSKNKKLKGKNNLFSINRAKNFLYTTNGFNLEEGLYSTGQTKEELEIILKKIEPFLIKQFKDTI